MELVDVLRAAVQRGASDVYLVVNRPPMLRVHGAIVPLPGAPALDPKACEDMVYSVIDDAQQAAFEERWELDCSIGVAGLARFRLNVFQDTGGIGAVLRVISAQIPTPQEIGLLPSIANLVDEPRGLVLVTGPTGSGKTTTLASLIETINQRHPKTVLTIEDPIEYVYQDKKCIIIQREVGRQTKSFANALRHALRQGPDVILVGEMRDLETIALAVHAAETGHLCFATLHTQDAPTTIDRIIDVFPAHQQQQVRVQLSTVLKAVVSQTLLPRKDGKGRVCAREVMMMTSAVGSIIRDGKTHMLYGAIEAGAKFGMISMDQYLTFLIKQNLVAPEDALAKAHNADNIKALMTMGSQAPL